MKVTKRLVSILAATLMGSSIALAGGIYHVDQAASSIIWKGSKVGGEHMGTVSLKNGNLLFSEDGLSGGSFEIDMTTINTTDVQGRQKRRVDRHLLSKDFFASKLFPAATLDIANVDKSSQDGSYNVTADLSVKGITKKINFTAYIDLEGNKATAKADIVFDRSDYDVRYRSDSFFENLGDKLIHDDVEVGVFLTLYKDS
jgi:polyisoprenoid-binding protein YceI